ncbi:hypothetical protein [Dethiosulfatibacter aminovorans]|nr:hypothetical protein [Dethiosulfatibacter aminovorans]
MKIIIAVVAVVVIGGGIFFFAGQNPMADMTTFEKIETSMKKQVEIKKADVDMNIDLEFEIDETAQNPNLDILKLVNDIEFSYDIKQDISDMENFFMEGLFSVVYQGESAFDVDFFMDGEKMVFGMPTLIDQPFFMTYEGYARLLDQAMSMNGTTEAPQFDFDMKRIMKDSVEFSEDFYSIEGIEGAENFDEEKYRTMIETGLEGLLVETEAFDVEVDRDGEKSTVKCDGYLLSFNETQFIDFALPLLEEAKTDPALKAIIIAKTQEYLDFTMNIYGEDFFNQPGMEDPYEEFNQIVEDLRTNYESGIEEMIGQLTAQRERSDKETFMVVNKMGIDKDGNMIYWDMSLDLFMDALKELEESEIASEYSSTDDIEGVTKFNVSIEYVINSINEDLTFTDYSTIEETGIDIVALAENPESAETQQVGMQIMGAFMQEMGTNPLFQALSQMMMQATPEPMY